MTETIDVRISLGDGGDVPAALALPGASDRGSGVLVIHEIAGLNDDMRRIASRFAGAGYVALVPDFLAGLGPAPLCILRFMVSLGRGPTGRPFRQLEAAHRWLAARPEVRTGSIGVAGFCIGGGFAILYAAGPGAGSIEVLAPFYGAVPSEPERSLARICPTVASYGGRDGVFGAHGERLDRALTSLGVEHDVRTYPDAGHAFMSVHTGITAQLASHLPMHGGYNEAAAEDAWQRTLAFLDRHLGIGIHVGAGDRAGEGSQSRVGATR
jgi:carboxymethylenebutenolidase